MLRNPTRLAAWLAAGFAATALAAPFTPTDDRQVLERLPSRAADPSLRDIADLRQRLARTPQDEALAVDLAWRYYARVAAEGDPRYIGYAQAALAPWWDSPSPPPRVRVIRAVLRQFNHDFDGARADLQGALKADPADGEAWAWTAAIDMVQARYADAREACRRMATQASPLVVTACVAAADSLTGRAAEAAATLRAALGADVSAPERLWALTRLAEIDERRGDFAAAEQSFRAAQALGIVDGYLLGAHADFLLDRGRPAEVLALLKGQERNDVLLLRLALAAKASASPELARWQAELGARFDAARRRGDSVHEKEESRFALALLGDTKRALELAARNWAIQKEPADARVLLEAAVAANSRDAAKPVLDWMAANRVESAALRALAAKLEATR